MNISEVISALTASLGPPDEVGTFKGQPCAAWGVCRYAGRGIDCHVFEATGAVHVDLWQLRHALSARALHISECGGTTSFHGADAYDSLDSADAVAARRTGAPWPVIVPLSVAVECAKRVLV